MNADAPLWRVSIEIADVHVPAFEEVLEPFVESLMWTVDEDVHGLQRMEGFVTVQPDRARVVAALAGVSAALGIVPPDVIVEEMPVRDWVVENLKDFPPIIEGRFFIYASHITERPLAGRIPMRIDPGAAFGTGTHATTSGCLQAIDKLGRKHAFKRPLDVGTGSGILAIAMAKMWRIPISGTDIDPVAVTVATRNAHLNRVADLLNFKAGPGFSPVPKTARFDLITANILARPLTQIAADLARHLLPGGHAVLSGLLVCDERFVVGAYMAHGLILKSRHVRDGWLTLVMRKR